MAKWSAQQQTPDFKVKTKFTTEQPQQANVTADQHDDDVCSLISRRWSDQHFHC